MFYCRYHSMNFYVFKFAINVKNYFNYKGVHQQRQTN